MARINTKEAPPFPFKRPNNDTPLADAQDIEYRGGILLTIIDYLVGGLSDIEASITLIENFFVAITPKNIFPQATSVLVNGKYLNPSNGAENDNSSYSYTENYIEVKASTRYTGSCWAGSSGGTRIAFGGIVCYYDENKQFISGEQTRGGVIVTPAQAKYIRVSELNDHLNNYRCQIEEGSEYTSYEAWFEPYYTLEYSGLPNEIAESLTSQLDANGFKIYLKSKEGATKSTVVIPLANLSANGLMSFEDKNILSSCFESAVVSSKNLFHIVSRTDGKYQNPASGAYSDNESWCVVENMIPVSPQTTYIASAWKIQQSGLGSRVNASMMLCYYDSSQNFISGINSVSNPFTTPSDCAYIKVSMNIDQADNYAVQIEDGSQWTSYEEWFEPYVNIRLKDTAIPDELRTPKRTIIDITASQSLRSVLESITDASAMNLYTVRLAEGTYELSNDITSEELADSSFKGVFIPDYVDLEGVNRDKCIISLILETKNQNVSVLNMRNTCNVRNLTITGTKTRYTIHDDWANNSMYDRYYYRIVENCIMINDDGYYGAVYGCGVKSGSRLTLRNCVFIGRQGILWHDNVNFTDAAELTIENCETQATTSDGIIIRSLASTKTSLIHIIGNNVTGYVFREDTPNSGAGLNFIVDGYGNNYDVPITITTSNPSFANWKPNFRDLPSETLQNGYYAGTMKYDNGWKYWNGSSWTNL